MKVIIGYDGSASARDAVHELHRAGLPDDTQATVVCVADVWPRLPAGSFAPAEGEGDADAVAAAAGWRASPIVRKARELAERSVAEAQALAAEGGALVKGEFPGWTVAHATYAGSPYGALVKAPVCVPAAAGAQAPAGAGAPASATPGEAPPEARPDLIVVGSQGRSALGRLVLGSVSQNVLTHAPCSVRISRRRPDGAAPRSGNGVRLIVGIDGSRHSAMAVSAVAARAWPAGTQVKVVAAVDLRLLSVLARAMPSAWDAPWRKATPDDEAARAWACRAAAAVAEELRAAGLAAEAVVEEADPRQLLVREAEAWAADCIFVGARGHGAVAGFLLGSVSASVAARAPCSVEVVRQG